MSSAVTKPPAPIPEITKARPPRPPVAPPDPLDRYPDIAAAATEDAAFTAHHRHLGRIEALRGDCQTLLARTLAANGHPGSVSLRHTPVADVRTAETADLELPALRAALAADIAAREDAVWADLDATLDQMVRDRRVGVIDWLHKPGVCTFTFHLCRTEVETGAWTTLVGGRERELVRRHHHTRHRHHLIGATAHPLPAAGVARPTRVQEYLDGIPPRIRGKVRVVDGTLISKSVDPWDQEGARWVETESIPVQVRDPAVVLGDYVLTGWTLEEVEAERILREDHETAWAASVGGILTRTLAVALTLALALALAAVWGVIRAADLVTDNWGAILHGLKIIAAAVLGVAGLVTLGLFLWHDPGVRKWLGLDD